MLQAESNKKYEDNRQHFITEEDDDYSCEQIPIENSINNPIGGIVGNVSHKEKVSKISTT